MDVQLVRAQTEQAIRVMCQHPEARRHPLPSVKAGRLAMRELGMTRAARKGMRMSASDFAYQMIGDTVADAYHLADEYGFMPEMLDAFHEVRLSAVPFSSRIDDAVLNLVYFLGNILHLGSAAYGLWDEALLDRGREHYNAECPDL